MAVLPSHLSGVWKGDLGGNDLAASRERDRGVDIGSIELRQLIKQLKQQEPTARGLNLLFWYRKGEQGQEFRQQVKDYLEGSSPSTP